MISNLHRINLKNVIFSENQIIDLVRVDYTFTDNDKITNREIFGNYENVKDYENLISDIHNGYNNDKIIVRLPNDDTSLAEIKRFIDEEEKYSKEFYTDAMKKFVSYYIHNRMTNPVSIRKYLYVTIYSPSSIERGSIGLFDPVKAQNLLFVPMLTEGSERKLVVRAEDVEGYVTVSGLTESMFIGERLFIPQNNSQNITFTHSGVSVNFIMVDFVNVDDGEPAITVSPTNQIKIDFEWVESPITSKEHLETFNTIVKSSIERQYPYKTKQLLELRLKEIYLVGFENNLVIAGALADYLFYDSMKEITVVQKDDITNSVSVKVKLDNPYNHILLPVFYE